MLLYTNAIIYLKSLSNYEQDRESYNFDLKGITRLLRRLGNPQKRFLAIHIAGSNGKGAVGNLIYNVLREANYKVGFFSSPHLISITERIRYSLINFSKGLFKDTISKRDFADLIERIAAVENDGKGKISFFEALTAAAFLYFAEQEIDLAIVETGMGGRLDATNVLNPLLCVITSIGFDHCKELGNSLPEIAREKAGIIKKGSLVVSTSQKEEIKNVIEKKCREKKAELFEVRDATQQKSLHDKNILLSLEVLEKIKDKFPVSQRAIKKGFKKAYWPGRLELISITKGDDKYKILLDGGHNIEAANLLSETIKNQFPLFKITLVFSACRDKDIEGISRIIFPLCKMIIFTRFKNPRCETIEWLKKRTGYKAEVAKNIKEALNLAYKTASNNTLILVSGSLYLVGEAIKEIQISDSYYC